MRITSVFILFMMALCTAPAAQQPTPLAPTPRTVAAAQLADIGKMENQLVQTSALVRHTDTA